MEGCQMTENNEESLYPGFSKWLNKFIGCQYVNERKPLWGRQPDILGIKFKIGNGLRALLYIIEVKVIDSLTSAYNLIDEIKSRIAAFRKYNPTFYALHPYVGIYEIYNAKEIEDYVNNRDIKPLCIEDFMILLRGSPAPIPSNKILTIRGLKDFSWIRSEDEAKIFREAVKVVNLADIRSFSRNMMIGVLL